jgi:hypothetical protein
MPEFAAVVPLTGKRPGGLWTPVFIFFITTVICQEIASSKWIRNDDFAYGVSSYQCASGAPTKGRRQLVAEASPETSGRLPNSMLTSSAMPRACHPPIQVGQDPRGLDAILIFFNCP